jgi:hypothetical protein
MTGSRLGYRYAQPPGGSGAGTMFPARNLAVEEQGLRRMILERLRKLEPQFDDRQKQLLREYSDAQSTP